MPYRRMDNTVGYLIISDTETYLNFIKGKKGKINVPTRRRYN